MAKLYERLALKGQGAYATFAEQNNLLDDTLRPPES